MEDTLKHTARFTDFGGVNIIYHTRSGPFLINRHDVYINGSLREYGEFSHLEWELFEQIIPAGSTICEVGANFGAHTVNLARVAGPAGAVHAFEPQRLVYQALCGNVALQGLPNVWCYNAAVGERSGKLIVPPIDYERPANIGALSMRDEGPGESVDVVRLDDFLRVDSLFLLKVDVEGMELDVLTGAAALIAKHRPGLYVENDRVDKSYRLIRYIQSLYYRLYWHLPPLYNPDNHFGEQTNIYPNIVSVNMLCIPRELETTIAGLTEIVDPAAHPLKAA